MVKYQKSSWLKIYLNYYLFRVLRKLYSPLNISDSSLNSCSNFLFLSNGSFTLSFSFEHDDFFRVFLRLFSLQIFKGLNSFMDFFKTGCFTSSSNFFYILCSLPQFLLFEDETLWLNFLTEKKFLWPCSRESIKFTDFIFSKMLRFPFLRFNKFCSLLKCLE